jgi:hypothetical protein
VKSNLHTTNNHSLNDFYDELEDIFKDYKIKFEKLGFTFELDFANNKINLF